MLYSCGGVVVTSSHKGSDFYFDCASDNQICKFTALRLRTAVLWSACVGDAGGFLSLLASRSTFIETCFFMYKVLCHRLLHPEEWILHDANY